MWTTVTASAVSTLTPPIPASLTDTEMFLSLGSGSSASFQ